MDVFNLLSYINKVSLFAFFITTLVVVYQIYILKKEKTKTQTPQIPDFKEGKNLGEVANFTSLPSSLIKKELKPVNYSKLIFLIITLLTIIIIIFVISIIQKNNSARNQATKNSPKLTVTKAPIVTKPLEPSPIAEPTVEPIVEPTAEPIIEPVVEPTVEPTEIILAQAPSLTPELNPTADSAGIPQVLPETGSIGKGLLIIGVAISTIFLAFWF